MKAIFLLCLAAGCAGSTQGAHNPSAEHPTCKALASACHARDSQSETAHECHLFFHDSANTEEQCQAKRAECASACGLASP